MAESELLSPLTILSMKRGGAPDELLEYSEDGAETARMEKNLKEIFARAKEMKGGVQKKKTKKDDSSDDDSSSSSSSSDSSSSSSSSSDSSSDSSSSSSMSPKKKLGQWGGKKELSVGMKTWNKLKDYVIDTAGLEKMNKKVLIVAKKYWDKVKSKDQKMSDSQYSDALDKAKKLVDKDADAIKKELHKK